MKAIGFRAAQTAGGLSPLIELDLPIPEPRTRDLRVSIKAISVNPIDTKMRARTTPPLGEAQILGYDASGIVDAIGSGVTLFRPGDEVFYAGAINRPGTNSALHVVDERIVGRKPKSLSFASAAALPLTSITAWELLFDRLGVVYGSKAETATLLIINGAGGVGSILIQLARRLTGLTIVATASRPETIAWCREMGAHHVIDHHHPLNEELKKIRIAEVKYVASLSATDQHLPAILKLIAPQGRLALIDDPAELNILPFKSKCVSIHWEGMFARSLFETPDMINQHRLLNEVADLVDAGVLRSTLTEDAGAITPANLEKVHDLVKSGRAIGKTVLSGGLQGFEEGLDHSVIEAVAFAGHRDAAAMAAECRCKSQTATQAVAERPTDDAPGEQIHHHGQIQPALTGPEWSKKRVSASSIRTVRAPFSAYGSPFKPGSWPWRHHDISK